MPADPLGSPEPAFIPTRRDLFFTFVRMSLSGFGGVLPWARRIIVDERRWMSAEAFNEAFALCQFLPGPNIVNFSVVYGSRVGGRLGALLALLGLVAPPVVLVLGLGALYARFGEVAILQGILAGISAAAAGLVIGVSMRMAQPLVRRRRVHELLVVAGIFAAVGLLRLPLPWVLAIGAPISLALSWRFRR